MSRLGSRLGPQPDWSGPSNREEGPALSDDSDSPRSEPEPIIAMHVEEWAALAELFDGLVALEWLTLTALPE